MGLGALLSSLTALDHVETGFVFRWSWLAPPAFALGVGLGWGYWRMMFRLATRQADSPAARRTMALASIGLLLVAFGSFLYPLRFAPREHRTDVAVGLSVAILTLSLVGWGIRRLVRAFEESDREEQGDDRTPRA